ncbi:unnamed protein product [Adineta steineri]|uniref:G-protein coupled receptors family 1 profile domain-containing protein n=1 Tax=Adineta steineri TaxID=433720 RepID=A0A818RIV5_9BILA|nr:unnamed protein product [Adineta steineri]CAF3654772.1 unnamed protein product [Adineta steineri]
MSTETNQTKMVIPNKDKELFEAVQLIFGLYLIPIVCIPGLIGNILCIIVFITTSMQRFLTTQFLLFLAILDTIKLSNDLLYSIVLIIQAFDQEFGKKLFLILYRYCHYINTVSTLCAAWLTLFVAIESLFLGLPVSFRYEIVPFSTINQTLNDSDSPIRVSKFGSSRFFRVYSIVMDIIRAIIPSFLLFYLNTRIVYLLCRMKSSAGTAFYRLTISLIIIIGCFICCYFPDALLSLVLNMGYIDESYQKRAIREISDFFITLNSAINFLVYFSISYTFRRSILRLFERKTKSYYPTTYADIIQRQRQQQQQQQQEQQEPLNNMGNMV